MHAERFDGLVATGGCDKSMPGMMMAIARLNLPGVFVYNGSTLPGYLNGKALDITSVFEAIGACAAGTITEDELHAIEKNACPGEGACGGMFTANTMSSIGEALGLSLPGSASPPAVDRRREDDATAAGAAVVEMLRAGIRPSDILTKQAFENAIALAQCARRLDQRRAAPARDRQRGGRRARARRLQPHCGPRAAHRRHEAGRQVPHDRPRPHRRGAGRAQAPARRRADPRRRDDGDGTHDGREPRRHRPAGPGRHGRPSARRADQRRGRAERADRLAGTEGIGGEGRRTVEGTADVRRRRSRVRRRGRRDGGRSWPERCSRAP